MREPAGLSRIERLMVALGRRSRRPARVYLTGGACAVLLGWRETTLDVDLSILPDDDEVLRLLPVLKEELSLNVELAAPSQFLPPLPGWEERSLFIRQEGPLTFLHYDFYAQALAKIERGHAQDRGDVAAMLATGRVQPAQLRSLYAAVRDQLYRYPAVDPTALDSALEVALKEAKGGADQPPG